MAGEPVLLPHTAVETPLSYLDETAYQRPFTYQAVLPWDEAFADQDVVLQFDAAMADAGVYLNGAEVAAHRDGYTPFEARLTGELQRGDNLITVKIDGSENPAIPPFGGRIDYLTYAGIYRDVWLVTRPVVSIRNIKVEARDILQDIKAMDVYVDVQDPDETGQAGVLTARLLGPDGSTIAESSVSAGAGRTKLTFAGLEDIELWDLDRPVLYRVQVELDTPAGPDRFACNFGFRKAEFRPDGFFLNGNRIKLMGLNRHQSFPYSGYAQGKASQERDAEILKRELACNVVRTSHYPQSPWFLDHCDRIGLLVLTEIPGWQHIGDQVWKDEAVRNVRRMIERDWNHPSIITWGVRINESEDDHDFYSATNALARKLDPTRQTSGIRKHARSELLEDIYTMNDFTQGSEEIDGGNLPALKTQREQTGLSNAVPYMVTECNGHMFPTKVFDQEQRQAEHVLRHLNVLDRAFGDPEIAGVIGWCMFDYNTHKDFGSGDRICHHGVLTMFREPKFAAFAYASQGDPVVRPVLKPVTFYARGERNIGGILPLIVLTNCDAVQLQFPDGTAQQFTPARDRFPNLPHAPVIIGRDDVDVDTFGKWGMNWQDLDVQGLLDGKVVIHQRFAADPVPTRLEVRPDRSEISATDGGEVRVAVRALDQAGNGLPFLADQATIRIEGPADLIGPAASPLIGGTTAFWIRATGTEGDVRISVATNIFAPVDLAVAAVAHEPDGGSTH